MSAETVQVKLVVEAGEDSQERDEITTRLRRDLLQLNVDSVERLSEGEAPAGTRAVDIAAIGTLLVNIGQGVAALTPLVTAVRSWLAARGSGTVKMQIGADTIEVSGNLSDHQKTLVDAWIKAHEAH